MTFLAKIRALLSRLFGSVRVAPSIPVESHPLTPLPLEVNGAQAGYANITNINDVLNALPHYFDDLRAFRRYDEDAYQIFAKIGGQLAVDDESRFFNASKIWQEFLDNPPAIRCIFPSDVREDEKTCPVKIAYIQRFAGGQVCLTGDGHVSIPSTGLNYQLVLVWRLKGKAIGGSCFINIDDKGTVNVVPAGNQRVICRSRNRNKHGLYWSGAVTKKNGRKTPHWIESCASESGEEPAVWLTKVVSLVASAKRQENCILVRAIHGNMAAAWTIDKRDAKRFFAKRETGNAADGRRKRILHYVGDFTRVVGDREQEVRAHYRGEREFDWNGYFISISGLGFHHGDFFDSSLEALEDTSITNSKLVSMKRVGKMMRDYYNQPRFLAPKRKRAA